MEYTAKCWYCEGTGLEAFVVNQHESNDINYAPIWDFNPCPKCEGSGRLSFTLNKPEDKGE